MPSPPGVIGTTVGNPEGLCRHQAFRFRFAADERAADALKTPDRATGDLLSHYGPRWGPALLEQVQQILVPGSGFALLDFLNAGARDQYA
jgi:hypothetical protein